MQINLCIGCKLRGLSTVNTYNSDRCEPLDGWLTRLLFSLFNGISTFVSFNVKAILVEEQRLYYFTYYWGKRKMIDIFLKCIRPKVNVIARLELELAEHDVAVQHAFHNTTGRLPAYSADLFKALKTCVEPASLLRWAISTGIVHQCITYSKWQDSVFYSEFNFSQSKCFNEAREPTLFNNFIHSYGK